MPKSKTDKFREKIKDLKEKIQKEKQGIQRIEDLLKRKVERKPGIWEYDFDELESEMWKKHESIEIKIKDLSKEISECSGKSPKSIFRFFKNLRGIIVRQNVINQEIIPLYLANLLSLQKVKDRLNSLENKVKKISREKDDLIAEIEESKIELAQEKKKKDE